MSEDESAKLSRRELLQGTALAMASTLLPAPERWIEAASGPGGRLSVAQYILARLSQLNVKSLFGVPGATCDPLFAATAGSDVAAVITASDLEAGYAADGYARVRGLGAVSVTYGVGTLGLIATVSGAYAERSPVVVLNGGPSAEDLSLLREHGTLFSHSNGRERTDLVMFSEVTGFAARIDQAATAPAQIDRALSVALTRKLPVYLEVAKDLWEAHVPAPRGPLQAALAPTGEEERLAGLIAERLKAAARPALLLGIEVDRYGLAGEVTALVSRLGIPWATTFLGKSVIAEQTPGFLGVYNGDHAVPSVQKAIEGADALLALGCVMGRQYRHLVLGAKDALVRAAAGEVWVGKQRVGKGELAPLVAQLGKQAFPPRPELLAQSKLPGLSFEERRASLSRASPPASSEPGLTYDEALSVVSGFLDESFIALTDTSLSMYPAAELNVTGNRAFLCNAVWQSIGYSVGAAVGVGLGQARRPLVLCGDGGFQMTAQALSTLAAQGVRAIVIVLDNGQYGIEQWLLDPGYFGSSPSAQRPYLALHRWDYPGLAKALGVPFTRAVATGAGLKEALAEARGAAGPAFIAATIKRHDLPSELRKA